VGKKYQEFAAVADSALGDNLVENLVNQKGNGPLRADSATFLAS